jgi:hypothetical protein
MDYSRVVCPVAEEVSYRRHVVLNAHALLCRENVRLILDAARKVYDNRRELM